MTANLPTRHSLLIRLDDPQDREAWDEFVSIYWPLIYRVCRQRGLQHADAENVAQDVQRKVELQTVELPETARRSGFRRWLATVARNAAIDAIRRSRPDVARGGTSVQETLREIQDRDDWSEVEFRHELERQAFRWAARRIRDEFSETTWAAFWETMVGGQVCPEVATQLNMSLGAVYTARSRVMQRLKTEVKLFDWQAASDEAEQKEESK